MAIAFDSVGTGQNVNNSGTIFWTHTINSANTVLLAMLGKAAGTITNVAFAGTNMTKIIRGSVASTQQGELLYLINPPLGLGTFNGTWSTSAIAKKAVSMAYTGVNQMVPIVGSVVGTAATTSGSIVNTTLYANDLFVGGISLVAAPGTTSIGIERGTGGTEAMGADSTGGTLRWTNSNTTLVMNGAELNGNSIAFDAAGAGSSTAGGTITWTHTVTGTSPVMVAFVGFGNSLGSVTSLKFAGQALTKVIGGTSSTTAAGELWYLLNPPTGLGTFNGTATGVNPDIYGISTSYTGVDQTTPLGGSVMGTVPASSSAGTVTYIATKANSWLVGGIALNNTGGGLAPVATGQKERGTASTIFSTGQFASNGPLVNAATGTLAYTYTLGNDAQVALELIPTQPPATNPKSTFKTLAGVGNI